MLAGLFGKKPPPQRHGPKGPFEVQFDNCEGRIWKFNLNRNKVPVSQASAPHELIEIHSEDFRRLIIFWGEAALQVSQGGLAAFSPFVPEEDEIRTSIVWNVYNLLIIEALQVLSARYPCQGSFAISTCAILLTPIAAVVGTVPDGDQIRAYMGANGAGCMRCCVDCLELMKKTDNPALLMASSETLLGITTAINMTFAEMLPRANSFKLNINAIERWNAHFQKLQRVVAEKRKRGTLGS
jgi:hypothetical protein